MLYLTIILKLSIMANMSYCRWENTLNDFRDCINSANNEGLDELSTSEIRAAKALYEEAKEFVEQFEGDFDDID